MSFRNLPVANDSRVAEAVDVSVQVRFGEDCPLVTGWGINTGSIFNKRKHFVCYKRIPHSLKPREIIIQKVSFCFIKTFPSTYRCHMQGSQQRNTWPRCWVTCHYACCRRRRAGCHWEAPQSAGTVESRFLAEWTCEMCVTSLCQGQLWQEATVTHRVAHDYDDLPCPRVHVVAVEVIHKAILAGWESFIASMDIDATAGAVKRAAVAVTSLRDGTFCLGYKPHFGSWKENKWKALKR